MRWDVRYALGPWRHLDRRCDGATPLSLIRTWSAQPVILDLGCGTSANMPLRPGQYRHYHGVDISVRAITRARRLKRPHTSFQVADMRSYHTTQRYDAILLREVLDCLSTVEAADLIRRLPEMLTATGRIVVQTYDLTRAKNVLDMVEGCGVRVERRIPVPSRERRQPAFLVLARDTASVTG